MNYIEVKILTNHEGADIICGVLTPFCNGFIVDDPQDIEEFSKEKTTKWDYIDAQLLSNGSRDTSVTLYLDDSDDGKESLEAIKAQLAILENGIVKSLSLNGVKSEDWENNWKQYYKPFTVGKNLLVCPSWEQAENLEGRTILTIDPASSFGTGSHATTRLCMEQLDGIPMSGKSVLDVGCGSGILLASMLLLGASHGVGCDIEENAVNTTAENILKNSISQDKFQVYQGDLLSNKSLSEKLSAGKYDVICANIVADVLKAMRDFLLNSLTQDGILIISGIIEEREAEVRAYYEEKNVQILNSIKRDGWAMLMLKSV